MANVQNSIRVSLRERSYDIEIGTGLHSEIVSLIRSRRKVTHVVVITDSNVGPLFAQPIINQLSAAGIRSSLLAIAAGEASKSVETANALWEQMLSDGVDRKSVVLAVGGGVIGDLAGFVAATFARGLAFIQVPTTLLAHVDSSVGGKVGVNLPGAKNIVGAFWQPELVVIDTATLNTLPEREFTAGIAEVVKYGVILDAHFFGYLESQVAAIRQRDPDVLTTVIARCCRLKADIVEQDEREETGLRAVLNYGHTFCHAFEASTNYGEYLHGEAVAVGMVCAATLAAKLGRVDPTFCERQRQLLVAFGLPVFVGNEPTDQLLAAMQRDKKTEYGKLRFVLPSRLGHVELVDQVPAELVIDAINENRYSA